MYPNITITPDFISKDIERETVNMLDSDIWKTNLVNRIKHFGYEYTMETNNYLPLLGNPVPEILKDISLNISRDLNQITAIEYLKGQNISMKPLEPKNINILTLLEPMNLVFYSQEGSFRYFIQPRTLIQMNEAVTEYWNYYTYSSSFIYDDYGNEIYVNNNYRRIDIIFGEVSIIR